MTFMLFKNNRPVGNKKFATYELCRQWARKLARKQPVVADDIFPWLQKDFSRMLYRTPTLGDYGYEIRRI